MKYCVDDIDIGLVKNNFYKKCKLKKDEQGFVF